MPEKHWKIDVFIDEHEDRTRARAKLDADDTGVTGIGTARLHPVDTNVPEIGDELAVSRALADLAHRLLEAAANDIEAVTHQPVHLSR